MQGGFNMELFGLIIVVIGLINMFKWLGNLFGLSSSSPKTLTIDIQIEQLPDNPGLWTALVHAHGGLYSPPIGYPLASIRAIDVTDADDFKPLFCSSDDWADEEGLFHYQRAIETPHSVTDLNGSTIGIVPLSILKFPRRGRRKLRVFVRILGDRVISLEKDIFFDNPVDGYLDQVDKIKSCEVLIARLAFATSAVDGKVDKVETSVITKFFSDRLSEEFEGEKRKQKVTDALQESARVLSGQTQSEIFREIQDLTNQLVSFDDAGISEVAFELCLQVIVADGKIEVAERKMVELLRSTLNITLDDSKNIEDRLLSIELYVEDDFESQLGLPSGLSTGQKKSWLAKEYVKWKNRVTHSDPEKAREAEIRLNLIAKYRSQLDKGQGE
jgi:hypothetical protein